jgi:hypothetical protein
MSDIKFRFVVVEVCTGGRHGTPEILSQQVYDTTHKTLIKARDELIRKARAEHVKEFYEPGYGGEPVAELICKFEFKNDLVGYYHYDEGVTFLFKEDSPVYELIVKNKISEDELAERLVDLHSFHADAHFERYHQRSLDKSSVDAIITA